MTFIVLLQDIVVFFHYMWKENLYQPVEILIRNHEVFPIAEHQHSFFEMVYVSEGTGRFYAGESDCKVLETTYDAHSLFLIPPETTHCFTIETHSEYVFIRFMINYVEDYVGKNVAEVFRSPGWQEEIRFSGQDEDTVFRLFDFIRSEEESKRESSNYLLHQWINSILVIVARNIAGKSSFDSSGRGETDGSMYMQQYIQRYIHEPNLLSAENLGKTFNLSPNYIGEYFKRVFQEPLRQYIARNRLKMVESLLLNSRKTVKEIAYSMGYSDSSHLVKSFQKAYGIPPLKYRRDHSSGASHSGGERSAGSAVRIVK